eukprot:3725536-Amphidinium_carterae.1
MAVQKLKERLELRPIAAALRVASRHIIPNSLPTISTISALNCFAAAKSEQTVEQMHPLRVVGVGFMSASRVTERTGRLRNVDALDNAVSLPLNIFLAAVSSLERKNLNLRSEQIR